ncbi:unnamed protein product, partial [Pylaiella littoralis]
DVVEAQRRRIVTMMLKGNIYGLPGSTGTRWSNFREWAKNQHPMLSMLFAHELHPFSRSERFSVMMCYLCWAFFITAVFEHVNVDAVEVCNAGCNNIYYGRVPGGGQSGRTFVCGDDSGTNTDQISRDIYDETCDSIIPWWVLSFIIAAFTVPYSTILKFLATCACAQSLPWCLKGCLECLGSIVLKIFGVLSVVWLGMGITLSLELDGGMFLVTYLVGVMKSWMYWPILAGAVFTYKYKKKKLLFQQEHPGQVALAWPIDHQDPDLEVKVGMDNKPIAFKSPPGSPRAGKPAQPPLPDQNAGTTPFASPSPQQGQFFGEGQQMMMMMQQSGSTPLAPPPGMNNINTNPYGVSAGAPQLQHPGNSATPTPQLSASGAGATALPPGWEMRMEPDGRMLYIDHNTKAGPPSLLTHWNPPAQQMDPPISSGGASGPASPTGAPPLGYGVTRQQQGLVRGYPGQMQQQQTPVGGYPGQIQRQQPPMGYYPGQMQQQQPQMGGYPGQMQQQQQPQMGGYPGQMQQQPSQMGGYPGQMQQPQPQIGGYQQQQPPPPQQQQQQQQQQPVVMEFAVPDGVSAGDVVQINSPKGIIAVTIPDGTKSGDTLQIPLPA